MTVLSTVSVSLIPDKTQQRSHFPPCVNIVLFFSRGAFMKNIIRHPEYDKKLNLAEAKPHLEIGCLAC